jgi:hypothetical protein
VDAVRREDENAMTCNAGPDDGPQMEGWLIRPAHWWLM